MIMSEPSESVRLTPSAFTKSKAKLLRVQRKAIYLRGETFTITFKVHNPMKVDFPGGRFDAEIVFPGKRAEFVRDLAVSKLAPGKDWKSESTEFNALAEGYALVYVRNLSVKGGSQGRWVDGEDRDIMVEGKSRTYAIHGFHVETRRDYYTYFAFVVSAVSLAILVSERVFADVVPSWLCLGSWFLPSRYLQLAWYLALVVVALYVVFAEGRKEKGQNDENGDK